MCPPETRATSVMRTACRKVRDTGLELHVWTVDDPAEATAMLDLGVDGIMTDRPAWLRELLEKRGQWFPR